MRPPMVGLSRRGSTLQSVNSQSHVSPQFSNSNAVNPEPIEQREEVALTERYSRVLHPTRRNGTKWFRNNTEISTRVRKIIEGCFKGPWYSWKRVPQFYKDAWFSTFKTIYEWNGSIEHQVKANFDELAATRLKGMVSRAKSNGEKPEWILLEHWRVMLDYWRTPHAKEKSEKARASRLFNRGGLGPHRHRSGSRSYAKVQDVLEANNEDSSFIAVMKKAHLKPDGTYVDERARKIAEEYDEHVLERLTQMESSNGDVLTDPLTIKERNEIYVKVAGISKQGRVFGLGSVQNGVSISLDGSPVSPQATEEVEPFSRRVEELENELQKSRDENVVFQKRLEYVEKIVESLFGDNVLAGSASTPPS